MEVSTIIYKCIYCIFTWGGKAEVYRVIQVLSFFSFSGHFTDNADDEDNCVGVVRSGIPPSAQLFNGSICHIPRLIDMVSLAGEFWCCKK